MKLKIHFISYTDHISNNEEQCVMSPTFIWRIFIIVGIFLVGMLFFFFDIEVHLAVI